MSMSHASLSLILAASLLAACGQQASDESAAPSGTGAESAQQADAAPAAGDGDALYYAGAQRTADRFSTSDPIDRVVDWYWADGPVQQRAGQTWTVSKPERRDDGYLVNVAIISGDQGQSYVIYLTPRAGGGTDGRVRLLTPDEIKAGVKL